MAHQASIARPERLQFADARELFDLLMAEREYACHHYPYAGTSSYIRQIETEMESRGITVPRD